MKLKKYILSKLIKIKSVVSVNLVGSFWENPEKSNYKDIDIVIILDNLSYKKFLICKKHIQEIKLDKYNLSGYKIKINSKFGPLKFDIKKCLILLIFLKIELVTLLNLLEQEDLVFQCIL